MKGVVSTAVAFYQMMRKRRADTNSVKETYNSDQNNIDVNNTIVQSVFPDYEFKDLIQSGDPLLWVTTPDGMRWRVGIDHIYGIEGVDIFPRIFLEPNDCRGRRFYVSNATGKVVVNPKNMEGFRVATAEEIVRDISNIRYSTNFLSNNLCNLLWLRHIKRSLEFVDKVRSDLTNAHMISDNPVLGYHYAVALKAYVPGDVVEALNKDSVLSGLEWPDIYD